MITLHLDVILVKDRRKCLGITYDHQKTKNDIAEVTPLTQDGDIEAKKTQLKPLFSERYVESWMSLLFPVSKGAGLQLPIP